MKELQVRSRQRGRTVDRALLRSIVTTLLDDLLGFEQYELVVHLISPRTSAEINEQFLQHHGPTDVITFNLLEGYDRSDSTSMDCAGEVFVCVSEAERQAKEFHTDWREELTRYVVHGVLHLIGYDDLVPGKRAEMKREENRLLRSLKRRFPLTKLAP